MKHLAILNGVEKIFPPHHIGPSLCVHNLHTLHFKCHLRRDDYMCLIVCKEGSNCSSPNKFMYNCFRGFRGREA